MRVISGIYRGRKLATPDGDNTRPTLDRTKETIFNMISHDIAGAVCLDLFGGSGQIGIELISRGAQHCTIIDSNRQSISCIKRNVDFLGIDAQSYRIMALPYTQALDSISNTQYDIVYLDPPYHADYYVTAIQMLCNNNLLAHNCLIVCESSKDIALPETIGSVSVIKSRSVGSVLFTIYQGGSI